MSSPLSTHLMAEGESSWEGSEIIISEADKSAEQSWGDLDRQDSIEISADWQADRELHHLLLSKVLNRPQPCCVGCGNARRAVRR